jgi:hypothetical protein
LALNKRVRRVTQRSLTIGAAVQLPRITTAARASETTYRIEALLRLDNGITLYKVKSETEPFDRIVSECDLAPQP